MAKNIIILTGERGIGKTTVCRETIERAKAKEYTCGGILTLTRADGELDVQDADSGDVRRLTIGPDVEPAVVQGRFRFDPDTLAWGNELLARARCCQLLVVDELGPLELERGGGWYRAFNALHRSHYALALVVVRPELVVRAQLRLPVGATTVFTITHDDRDSLPEILLEALERRA